MTELLTTENLRKQFGGLTAVDGIDIAVNDGEILGLIGPNGSGKTTTFNLITGFLEADAGSITFQGHDITDDSPDRIARRGLGRTFQVAKPFGRLTVMDNMLVPNTGDLVGDRKRDRALEILQELELSRVADERGDNLSGGQKKLLEIARVLMLDPQLILLDEPAAGVNPALMDEIMDRIRSLNETGRTIFLIEHDMSVIAELCDRVIVMNNGEIVTTGTFEEIRENERVREAYLGQ